METETGKRSELKIPRTPGAFFIYASKPHKVPALLAVIAVLFASAMGPGTSYVFKFIVDAAEQGDTERVLFWGLLFPAILFLVQALYRFSGFMAATWTTGAVKTATDGISTYILKHSHTYYSNRFAGSISSKIRNVSGAIEEIVPDFLWAHLSSFVGFLVTFLIILQVDLNSALLFIVLILVLFLVNKQFAPKKAELSKQSSEANTILGGRVVDTLSNIAAVRQYAKYEEEFIALSNLTDRRRLAHRKNWFYTEKLLITNVSILFVFSVILFWVIVGKWTEGVISTGDFVMITVLIFNISGSLVFIGRAFNAMAKTVGELREALDDLLIDYEIKDKSDAFDIKVDNGEIIWRNVDFKFENINVFSNFNLQINAKNRIGLVGSSGAGKTTFVSLLLRQHDLSGGEILIDGQNIADATQDSLRKAIAVVPQEPALFHRSIKDNIVYGNRDASMEEIIEVAKKAHAHEFIEKLPEGYDTLVGERGVKLSGGQKQRIAIARAMLKNAPILILDEATSALDSESEVLIQKALHELMENKTVIAIAHRLSTLREMDRIIVLENGKIIEDGNHNDLKDEGGVYSKLWGHQSGGFLQD